MYHEKIVTPRSGWLPLLLAVLLIIGATVLFFIIVANSGTWGNAKEGLGLIFSGSTLIAGITVACGLVAVAPNEARVLLLFGEYQGSIRNSGFFWVNPFYSKLKISLRVRNFETGSLTSPEKQKSHGRPSKVNDRDGNPIEISAVVVWKVVDTAEVLFEVDDYVDYVGVQSEAALRGLATKYPYDSEDHETSLRGSMQLIADQLREDIQARLGKAGVEIIEARISHLAYAPEIAAAMLQRQQANAIVAARTRIVEGAVGMVQMALENLANENIVELDDERRAAMVSNLLVVLCSDRHAQPVVNAGSLY